MEELKLGIYKHFKGKIVQVIGIARHSETEEEFVVYKDLYENEKYGKGALWLRPKSMFLEIITRDGKTFSRFEYVREKE